MIRTLLLLLLVDIASALIFAATRPDSFRVDRSLAIKAPPEKIFAQINDLHRWRQWSPWENIDPQLKRTYYDAPGGAPAGLGAAYAWEGDSKVGSGRMEIVDSLSPTQIVIKLDFVKPFEAHNMAQFVLETYGDTTLVTRTMYGPSPYISKVIGLVFSMDRMVGKDFEAGLANLKAIAESAPK